MDLLLTHGYHLEEDPAEKHPYPPLGLLYLSSHLKQRGTEVEIFDTTFNHPADFGRLVADETPPIVGISGNLMTRRNVLAMTRLAKDQGASTTSTGSPSPTAGQSTWSATWTPGVVSAAGARSL